MKAITTLTLLAAIAAFMAPKQAMAGDKEKALIGGLIGGIIIGSVIADDDHHHSTTISYRHGHGRRSHCDHGHWEWRSEKRWVPGYYRYSRDRCGHRVRVWVSGYYDFHKTKVWVDSCHCGHYDRPRHRHHSSYKSRHDDRHDRHDRYDRRDDRRDHRHHKSDGQIVRNF